jgi:hypothetical protein
MLTNKITKQDILNFHKQAFMRGNFRGITEVIKDGKTIKHIKLDVFLNDVWRFIHSEQFKDDSFEALYGGGAGGGKSFGMCYFLLMMAECYPDTIYAIIREELKQLRESTYITMEKVVKYLSFPQKMYRFNGQDNHLTFKNGSRIYLKDGAYRPSDPEYDRWGSTEFTGAWIEEGQQVAIQAKEAIQTRTGRANNEQYNIPAFLIITGNPGKNWMYTQFYKPAKEGKLPDYRFFYPALVHDNPFIAKSYIQNLKKLPETSTRKQRQYYGNWEFDDDPTALVSYSAIINMFSIRAPDSRQKFIIVDAARDGGDKITCFIFAGLQVIELQYWEKAKTNISARKIIKAMIKHSVPASRVLVDVNGVGGGLADQLPDGVVEFINNAKAIDGNYRSLKDQCGYILADYVNKGKIGLEGLEMKEEDKELIIEEFEWLKSYDDEKGGKARLIPKDEIKKAIGRSPDFLDTFLMRMYFEITKKKSSIKEEKTMINLVPAYHNQGKFVNCCWYIGDDNNIAVWFYQTESNRNIFVIDYLEQLVTTPADFMYHLQEHIQDKKYILNKNYIAYMKIDGTQTDPKADIYRLLKKLGLTSVKILPKVEKGEDTSLLRAYFGDFTFLSPFCDYGYYKVLDDYEINNMATKAFIAVIQASTLREQQPEEYSINSMRDVKRLINSDNPREQARGRRLLSKFK